MCFINILWRGNKANYINKILGGNKMEINAIASKVMNLLINNQVQEIVVWQHGMEFLLLDGTYEIHACECTCEQLSTLSESLAIVEEAGYNVWFSGYDVSCERVHIFLSEESDIAKTRKYTRVKKAPCGHSSVAIIGRMYFHR